MTPKEISVAQEKARAELLDGFIRLADEWALNINEQQILIGEVPIDELLKSPDSGNERLLTRDAVKRLELLLGIRNDIHILYDKSRWGSYIRTPNRYFDGLNPLDYMLQNSTDGVANVQAYLKSAILGGYS